MFFSTEHITNPKINWSELLKKRLPIIDFVSNYSLAFFFQDVLAGITVGITEIPQGIAYAAVAGEETRKHLKHFSSSL